MQDKNTINELNNNVNNLITESYDNDNTVINNVVDDILLPTKNTPEYEVFSIDKKGNKTPVDYSKPNATSVKPADKKPDSKEELMRKNAYDLAMLDDAWVISELPNIAKAIGCSKGDLEKMWKAEKKKLKQEGGKKEKKGFVIEPSNEDVLQPNASIEYQYAFKQDKTIFKCDENDIVFYWNNVFWETYDKSKGQKHAMQWLKTNTDQYHATEKKAESCFKTLRLNLDDMPTGQRDVIVSIKNGWLKLNENNQLEVMKPDRKYNIRSATKIKLELPESGIYQPKPVPANSHFKRFLDTSLPDIEDQDLLQEYTGYTFCNDKQFQNFIVNIGDGGNGKGLLTHILEKIHYNPKAALLDTKDFDLEHLVHASIMIVSDAGQETNVEMLKETTGGDVSMIRQKHKGTLSVELPGKWWINANQMPRWNDTTNAIWTRILPIKWEGKFREFGICDPTLQRKIIDNELSIVLDWALEGLTRLYKRGGFLPSPKIKKVIDEMRGEQDNVRLFMMENEYQIDKSGCFMTKKQIYQAYQNWCNEHGNRQVSDVNFWKRLGIMFGNSLVEERKRISGGRVLMVNLKLPDDLKPEF